MTAVKRMRGAPLLGFILHLYLNVLVVTQAHPRPPHLAQIPQPIRSQRTLVLTLQCACNETSSSMRMKDRGVSASLLISSTAASAGASPKMRVSNA